jgi:small subunit ribosomal protein S21
LEGRFAHFEAARLVRKKGWKEVLAMIGKPLEVEVRDNLEKAMKILKQKMSKEGILQEVKRRRFYEKPSVKKKRKMREARKRRRREMKRRGSPPVMAR